MEILTTGLTHLPEIVASVMLVLGGQKGYEIYRKKKWSNGGRDRRSSQGGNSLSQGDKEFIAGCFKTQTKEITLTKRNDSLELVAELGGIIRDDGKDTREAIRALR